jgi:STE24 endopeptidase
MERPRRVAVAVAAAFVVAEAAVLLLRPRDGVIAPAPVDPGSYFTPEELHRAREFRRGQLVIFATSMAVEAGALAWLVRRPPAPLRAPSRRPIVIAAGAGAALSVGLTVAQLPLSAISHRRSVDVGLSTQDWGPWLADAAKAAGVGTVFAGAGGAAAVALMRRLPRTWWLPGSALALGVAVATLYLGPVVLDPIFNRFTVLPDGSTRSDVLALAREAGVDVGQVYEVDASRRTTAANAYVTGLGRTKRVVLYDTLLNNFSRDELRLVVAHELGHVRHRDVPNGLLYLAIVAPFGLLAVAQLTRRLAPQEGARPGPAVLPALALSIVVMATTIGTISNQLSRVVEARADAFALDLTAEPKPFISFEQRIALRNLADPDPPEWQTFLLATHPPILDRIGIGVAYERAHRG